VFYTGDLNHNYLAHYGVLGMKWGVRRNASKAYVKAVKKQRKIEDKASKLQVKSAKKQLKATKKMANSTTKAGMMKGLKLQAQANKLNLKSAKLQRKAINWVNQMNKTFAGYDVERVPATQVARGKNFVDNYIVTKVDN
jgi:hypothetical protein